MAALTFYIINVIKKFNNPTADCSRATVVERIISPSKECGEPTVNAFRKGRHFVSKKKGQSDKKYLVVDEKRRDLSLSAHSVSDEGFSNSHFNMKQVNV